MKGDLTTQAVDYLLAADSDLYPRSRFPESALHHATQYRVSLPVLERLIDAGSPTSELDEENEGILYYIVAEDYEAGYASKVCQLLLAKGTTISELHLNDPQDFDKISETVKSYLI